MVRGAACRPGTRRGRGFGADSGPIRAPAAGTLAAILNRVPVLRWGQPYRSLETRELRHFLTGAPVAEVDQANAALVRRDFRRGAPRARAALREIPAAEILEMSRRAGRLYAEEELPFGDGRQTPEDFVRAQSATTGLPESLCRANLEKNRWVLERLGEVLDALTRGLDLDLVAAGHGVEARGVPVSYQAQTPALGLVLPSNSPGVHTLWLPVLPLRIGLVLKPGSEEPWTPYRLAEAFFAAGIPREAVSVVPGPREVGQAVVETAPRSLIFGSRETIARYRGDAGVRVYGPGFSKIFLGDDAVDRWEDQLEVMVESVFANSGRSCINASGIWASRRTGEIAAALAERLGPVRPLPPDDPESALAAFPVPGAAAAIDADLERRLASGGATDRTAAFRDGPRFVPAGPDEDAGWLRPTVVECEGPDAAAANVEYLFPFVSVVQCPQERMIREAGHTLVGTAITADAAFGADLLDATGIDRLNLGPIPTNRVNWMQPHEGNLLDHLYRARAFNSA